MKEVPGLVSIIIPAYNAASFMSDTLHSILTQTYRSWEIIVVNDGSTDKTGEIARSFENDRIKVIDQKNSGVSIARNKGLAEAKGEFVCFFDADDMMTPEFIEVRVNALSEKRSIGFAGGMVETFPEKKPLRRAVAQDPEEEIHFFDPAVVTIPSNYLFRTAIIKDNGIVFQAGLNSSADRFFLLQVAKHTQGEALSNEKGRLLYRISEMSMSHHVTPKLALDYYKFYQELNAQKLLPAEKRKEIQSRYLFSIASSFFLVRHWGSAFRLLVRSFFTHPAVFFKLSVQRIGKSSKK